MEESVTRTKNKSLLKNEFYKNDKSNLRDYTRFSRVECQIHNELSGQECFCFYKMIVFKSGFSTNAFLMQKTFHARNTMISSTSLIWKRLKNMVVILDLRFTTKL